MPLYIKFKFQKMACETLDEGINLDCSNNIGGIKKIYIGEKDWVSSLTLSSPGDEISAINTTGSPPENFFEFQFTKNTSTYTENESNSEENGTTLYTQTITLVLNRREKSKRDTIKKLSKFKKLVIVVTDNNDINWYFGETAGMTLTTNEGGAGTTKQDRNGYTLTFLGEEPDPANTVTDEAVAAIIA